MFAGCALRMAISKRHIYFGPKIHERARTACQATLVNGGGFHAIACTLDEIQQLLTRMYWTPLYLPIDHDI